MKCILASFALCILFAQSALAQTTGRSSQTGPTTENGYTVFTATRSIESNASSVRIYGRAYGEKEKGCLDDSKNGFVDKLIQNANDFLDDLFKLGKNVSNELSGAKCATVVGQLKLVIDDQEIVVGTFRDYNFDSFEKVFDKIYGGEFNGKTVVAKLSVATQMNRNNVWTVFIESTAPN